MATKKVTTVEEVDETAPDSPTVFDQIIAKGEEGITAADALIDEMRGTDDAVLNVYRDGVGRGKFAFLFALSPEDITARDIYEKCRDEYGGGNYRMHIRDPERIVHNVPFSVEAPKDKPETAPVHPPGLGIAEVMAMMQASNDRQAAMFSESMRAMADAFKGNQSNQPAFDPVAAQASLMQQLVALKSMSEPKDKTKDAVDMFVQGISLAKDLSPKDGETNSSDILVKALEMFGGPMAEMAKSNLGAQTAPALPSPMGAPPNPMAPPPPTGDPQVDADAKREYEMGLQKMVLNQQLQFLLRQAAANKDPELYAELLLDQAGEERVLAFVGQENAIDQLVELNGEVASHREWFESLRASILELTAPEPASENEGISGEIIPATEPDAISDTDNAGHVGEPSIGDGGDAPNT